MKILACALAAFALAAPALAQPAHDHAAEAAPAPVEGVGVVRAVNARAGTVTLDHEPIASLGWPAMTMTFKLADPTLLQGCARGVKVRFQLQGHTLVALSAL